MREDNRRFGRGWRKGGTSCPECRQASCACGSRTRTGRARSTDPWRAADRAAKAAGFRAPAGKGYRAALVAFCQANGIEVVR